MSGVMGTTVDKIWTKQNGKNTEIGFTQSYLDEIISECWHITPASRTKVREKSPLLTVETNEAQFTIMSPIAGEFLFFNNNAMNFPDKLTETDVVCILGEREPAPPKKSIIRGSSGSRLWVADDIQTGFDAMAVFRHQGALVEALRGAQQEQEEH